MDRVLPWTDLVATVEPPDPKGTLGRPPIPLETMRRLYFRPQWFGYADPAMEEARYDVTPVRVFARVDTGRVPDETTMGPFRPWLERPGLTPAFLVRVRGPLKKHNRIVQKAPIVDATIISAPSSTKNKAKKRDSERTSTKKPPSGPLV